MAKGSSDPRKTETLTLRVTKELRKHLESTAKKNQFSLSQEVEQRLVRSVQAEGAGGGGEQAKLLQDLAEIMNIASASVGKPWWENGQAVSAIRRSFDRLLEPYQAPEELDAELALSPAGRKIYRKWQDDAQAAEQRIWQWNKEWEALRQKMLVFGVTAADDAKLLELTSSQPKEPKPPIFETAADKKAWRQLAEQRRIQQALGTAIGNVLTNLSVAPRGA